MDGEEAATQFGRADALFLGFGLGSGAVLVGTADVKGLETAQPAAAGIDIGRQDLDQVAEVGYVIDVWQGTGN